MELRHLRYFVAVAEAENLTRAATKYGVSAEVIAKRLRAEKFWPPTTI